MNTGIAITGNVHNTRSRSVCHVRKVPSPNAPIEILPLFSSSNDSSFKKFYEILQAQLIVPSSKLFHIYQSDIMIGIYLVYPPLELVCCTEWLWEIKDLSSPSLLSCWSARDSVTLSRSAHTH